MWRSLFSSSCDEWERSFEDRKALVEVQMAKRATEAERRAEGWELRAKATERRDVEGEKRTTEAVKRAAEAEKRAAEAEKRATEAEKRAAEADDEAEMVAGLAGRVVAEAKKRAEDAEKRAVEAEKRAVEAEEMAELAVINGSSGKCFERFMCPITQRLIKDPVITCDGHTYEREAIEKWFVMHVTSPLTGLALDSNVLVPNHAMRKAIEAYVPPHKRDDI